MKIQTSLRTQLSLESSLECNRRTNDLQRSTQIRPFALLANVTHRKNAINLCNKILARINALLPLLSKQNKAYKSR